MTLRKSLKDSEPPFPHLPSAAAMTLNPRPPVEEVEGHGVGVGHMKRHQGLDDTAKPWDVRSHVSPPRALVTASLRPRGRPQCSPPTPPPSSLPPGSDSGLKDEGGPFLPFRS